MYIISYRSRVNPKSKSASKYEEYGGAYINCWVSYKDFDGAKHLAKFYIKQEGWIPEVKTGESIVQKKWCNKKEKHYYDEALKHGYCLVTHLWPKDAEDANHDYESEEKKRA